MEPSQDNYPPDEPNTLKLFLSKTKRNDQDTDLYGSAEINLHGANGEIKAGAWINPIRNDPERFWIKVKLSEAVAANPANPTESSPATSLVSNYASQQKPAVNRATGAPQTPPAATPIEDDDVPF